MSGQNPNRHRAVAFLFENSIFLIGGALAALIWANISPDSYKSFVEFDLSFGYHAQAEDHGDDKADANSDAHDDDKAHQPDGQQANNNADDADQDDKQDDDIIAKTEARAVESRKRAAKKRKANSSFLSFGGSDDDSSSSDDDTNEKDDAGSSSSSNTSSNTTNKTTKTNTNTNKRSKIMKCSDVDTSFLPDRDRRVQDESLRTKLKKEYEERQRQLKQQKLEITYSWWDGSGHRRTIQVPQGTSIGEFLELVRINICEQFPELKKMSSDNMMYIKEDLIIPGDYTFYDLIKTKARGKSGPLFCFDVHDDLRMGPIDSRVEKDESHPGKIVDRSWYERNKHIFPANRWEIYDPSIDYGGYTIHGGEVN